MRRGGGGGGWGGGWVVFFKQKTAYEIKECDWSSDVCSSDLVRRQEGIDAIVCQGGIGGKEDQNRSAEKKDNNLDQRMNTSREAVNGRHEGSIILSAGAFNV